MEYTPENGRIGQGGIDQVGRAFGRKKTLAEHHSHSAEFKRQVAQAYLSGKALHGLAKQHDLSRNLIRIWVAKLEAEEFECDAHAAER
jgi:transposase-like protein